MVALASLTTPLADIRHPTLPTPGPTQKRVTQQLSTHWAPFKALRQRYAGSRFEQQLQLHLPQKHKATEQDSALRVEMTGLEDQADNAKPRELLWKPLSWLGTLRPTTANDAWDPALWQTFFSSTLGLEVPALSALPLTVCPCRTYISAWWSDSSTQAAARSIP